MGEKNFILTNLDVIRLRSSQGPDTDEHVRWSIEFDPDFADESETTRVVFGSLHAGGAAGWGDITVGAFFKNMAGTTVAELPEELFSSDAVESLYDFARSHLQPLLSLVGAPMRLPWKSPDVVVGVMDMSDAEEHSAVEAPSTQSEITA
jgi:hypothetical protein